jgi:shikimate kinase
MVADRPHIVVTGLMGVGKTTAAYALGAALGRRVRDSDADIEILFGASGADLVPKIGVDELHRLEAGVLLGALASDEPLVIAAAGWVIEDPQSRLAMSRRSRVAVLAVELDELDRRIRSGAHRRPMSIAELETASATRTPLFESIATWKLDASKPIDEIVASIIAVMSD